jgi:hypothetical protein
LRLCVTCGKAPKSATALHFSIYQKIRIGNLLLSNLAKTLSGAASQRMGDVCETVKKFCLIQKAGIFVPAN